MDEKSARKYRRLGKLPSQCQAEHTWATRQDPFAEVWEEVQAQITQSPGLEAQTVFQALQRKYPGRFQDGQLRTLQRRFRRWRATDGPPKEVFFEQEHRPGDLCASAFTWMKELSIPIAGQPFEHLLYHFVLTYSNWETGTLCFSESLESLSAGLQNALVELGGVPRQHRANPAQHLFGAQPADRRARPGADLRRAHRDLVCPAEEREPAAALWAQRPAHPVPAHQRVVGAQARRVPTVSLPGGTLPQKASSASPATC
jgi:hypothetical protein